MADVYSGEVDPDTERIWAKAILEQNSLLKSVLSSVQRAAELYPVAVESLTEMPLERHVYDISVEGNENFLTAQGIFVHNSREAPRFLFPA